MDIAVVESRLQRGRKIGVDRELGTVVIRRPIILAAIEVRRRADRHQRIGQPAIEDRATDPHRPQLPRSAELDIGGSLGLQFGIRLGGAELAAEPLEQRGKARPRRNRDMELLAVARSPVDPALGVECIDVAQREAEDAQGARAARRHAELLGPIEVAPLVGGADGQRQLGRKSKTVLGSDAPVALDTSLDGLGDAGGEARAAGLRLGVLVVAVVEGEGEAVRRGEVHRQLGRAHHKQCRHRGC